MGKRLVVALLAILVCGCSAQPVPNRIGRASFASVLAGKSGDVLQPVLLCVTAHVLTLRTGPDVSFPPVTWMTKDAQVTKLSSVGNWFEVTGGQYHGWVNRKYLGDCP